MEALEGFAQAAALDPACPEPRQREQQLVDFLERLTSLLENKVLLMATRLGVLSLPANVASWCPFIVVSFHPCKRSIVQQCKGDSPCCFSPLQGKVKGKKLQSMLGSLRTSQLGPCGDGRYQGPSGQKVQLEQRPLGTLRSGVNSGVVVLGKVLFSLTTEEKVPL